MSQSTESPHHSTFYSDEELLQLGFIRVGEHVLISRKATLIHPERMAIGHHVRIDDFCVLSAGQKITLGNYIHIGCYCALYGAAEIIMEDFSGLSSRVSLYTQSDDYTGFSLTNPMVPECYKPRAKTGKIILGRHVIIGANTTILPDITIAEGTAVGANTLISKNCQSWSVYFGNPAKRIKSRSKELLKLEEKFLAEEKAMADNNQ